VTHSFRRNWLTQLILHTEHQGELDIVALLFAAALLVGAYLLAVLVFVWDVF
jgi:hypothetical protein